MPKVEVEILRTRTVTIEESAVVELNVPAYVIKDEEVMDWIENLDSSSSEAKAIDAAMVTNDEDESIEYDEAIVLNP